MLKLISLDLFQNAKRSFSQQNGIIPVDREALIFRLECMFAKNVYSTCFKQEAL
jgi:hypothetical protein